jgi:hypothetical protein
MSPRASAMQVFHVYRFTTTVNGASVPGESFRWEGRDLIFTRAMAPDRPQLIDEVKKMGTVDIRVALISRCDDGTKAAEWKLKFSRVVNRGFDFLHSAKDDIVREAVAFLDAEMVKAS